MAALWVGGVEVLLGHGTNFNGCGAFKIGGFSWGSGVGWVDQVGLSLRKPLPEGWEGAECKTQDDPRQHP